MIDPTISHFKILQKVREDRLVEVYLVEGTGLNCKVALKFLMLNYTSNPEIKARFKQEAKATAVLNHYGVIIIHDMSGYGSQTFFAME